MKEDKKVPQLRFPEFTDAWKQRELCSLTKRIQGNDGRMDLDILTISAGNGWMKQEERFSGNIAGKEQKNYTLLHKGELSYNHGNSKLAKYGAVFSLQNFEEALVPRVYHSFKMLSGSAKFIEYYFATKLPDRELGKLISSGARMDGLLNIKYDDFMGIKLTIPSEMEQHKISTFFSKLDNTITLQQRKLNSLQKLKRGLLQKMFPKKGENIPEIRFPEFSDAWKQRKFGDFAKVSMCKRVFKEETTQTGDVPFFKIGTFGGIPDAFISRYKFESYKAKYPYPKKGDILISASGSIGRIVEYSGKDEYFQDSNIIWLDHDESVLNSFLKHVYSIIKWNGIEGTTIKRLYNDNVLTTKILTPSLEEQSKIGIFFTQLDNTITLQQRKLESLQKLKKGLLQQMFI